MTRPIPPQAIAFVKQHEGLRLQVYRDVGGVLTVGYGHTSPDLTEGQAITQAQADAFLMEDLQTATDRLATKVKQSIIDELTANQYSALLDLVFNVGTPGTRIWADLNARNFDQVVTKDIPSFVFARVGGQEVKVSGLVNRRADEVRLWSDGEPGSTQAVVSSAVTRSYATPAAPSEAKPRGGIGPAIATALASGGVAISQAGQAVKGVTDALAPYGDLNDHIRGAISTLALVSAGLAVTTLGLVWLRNRAVSAWGRTSMPSLPQGALPPTAKSAPTTP